MKLTIDEKTCLKNKLTLPEFLLVLSVKLNKGKANIADNLCKRKVLVKKDDNFKIAEDWEDAVDKMVESCSKGIDERLLKLAERLRDCYPPGKLPNTPYYYKCNKPEVAACLKRFILKYGDFPDEDFEKATKAFVASYQGNYRYLPLLKYFIMKNKTKEDEDGKSHIVEVSELLSYLENKSEDVIPMSDDELMLGMRN